MYIAMTLLAVALVVFLFRSRNRSLGSAILAFAQSMDLTPLYVRAPRRRNV